MLCILYVNAIGALLGATGILFERTLDARTTVRRWLWCVVILVMMVIPGVYRTRHASAVTEAFNPALFDSVTWMESLNPAIESFWLIASGMLLAWGVVTAARVWFLVRNRSRSAVTLDGVPVTVTDSIGPATVGVLRSRVIVPRWVLALPGPQRRYVLAHEDEHRRSHDSLLLFVASLTLLLAPWNLALWWTLRRLRLAVEMDCDNRVVTALGDADAYGELLFKVAHAASRGPSLQPAFLGSGLLERRLRALVSPAPLRRAQKFLVPAMAALLLIVVLSMPHPVLRSGHEGHATMTAQEK
jgi:beta-lactamase regulating signal transducer with metallopeptidase domain